MKFFRWLRTLFLRMDTTPTRILKGDGSWPFTVRVVGDDLVVENVRATCFGGANDPEDNGHTASGISTKGNPGLMACALPMIYGGENRALLKALGGSPMPRLPWQTRVEITSGGKTLTVPVIDLGPAKRTGNAIDLTIAAARFFKRDASATNFAMICSFRIPGAAKYAPAG